MDTLDRKEAINYARAAKLLQMEKLRDLAAILDIPKELLLDAMMNSEAHYRTFFIPKRKGGTRQIEAPKPELKLALSRLNYLLQLMYFRIKPDCVHGFVPTIGKSAKSYSIVSNALPHVNAKYVLNIDLKDFFHTISVWRVKHLFTSYPFYLGNDQAAFLALLTTTNHRLPMGASTSPVISNYACFLLDRQLMRMSEERGWKFTRYADDLTFSSNEAITETQIEEITTMIQRYGFAVNEKKKRLQSARGAQVVTGLKVNEKLNVDRKFIRSIRAMLHNWEKYGLEFSALQNYGEEQFIKIIDGKLNFLSMVKGKQDPVYRKLREKFITLNSERR